MSREQLLQRILLIDANPVDRALIIPALTQDLPGLQIEEIVNADELAQAIAERNFDLVITDYQLPWTNGLDVLQTLKAYSSNCSVIMFTNAGSEEIAVAAMKAGLDDYLIKSPANLSRLTQAVMSVWEKTQTQLLANRALQTSERRLNTLISNLPGYVYRVANDRNYTPEFISEGVFNVTGYRQEEYLIERTISCGHRIHPDDRDRIWEIVQQAVALQQPYECEYRITTKSGIQKWVWERGQGIYSDSGELLCLEGFVTDITARKAIKTALQESRQLYQNLVEHSPDIIERFDTQLRHLYTSPVLTQLTGIPAAVFLGKTCRELGMPETMVNAWETAAQALLQTGQKQIIEFDTPTVNGVRSFEMVIAPELTRDNVIESILCISRDVTERKAAQIALQLRAQQEQTLNRVVQRIRSSLDLATIFSTTIAEVTELLGVIRTSIVQYVPDRQCWQTLAVHCQYPLLTDTTGLEIPDAGNPYAAQLKQLQVVQVNAIDSIQDPINKKLAETFPPAWLLTPIVVNGKIWGSLSLSKFATEAPWKQQEIELATRVADQLAIAIQQAQLYQQAQQELRDRQRVEAALQQLNQELEQRVQERTEKLQMALSAAKMGTWDLNPQTNIVHWSPEEYTLFGFKTDAQGRVLDQNGQEISPHPTFELFLSCVHPDDRDYVVQQVRQALTQGSSFEVEYRLLRDGNIYWVYARGACVLDKQGKPARLIGIAMDITNRKQAEAALRRSERWLQNFSQKISVVVYTMVQETNGQIWFEYISPACKSIFEVTAEQAMQNAYSIINLIHPDDLPPRAILMARCIQNLEPFFMEYRIITPSGKIKWVQVNSQVEPRENGAFAWHGVLLDVSDRKQAETAIRQQAKQEKALRLVIHEIRQSLDLDAILTTAVNEVRHTLQADRVAVYRFNADWSGNFIVESVAPGWVKLVKPNIKRVWEDTYLQATEGGRYKNYETFAVTDIYTVGHQECHIALLEEFQARAYAIAPIFFGENLWGLLAVYQNSTPRSWQAWEIDLLQQIANQLAIAIQQSELYKQLQTELQERRQIEQQIRASLKEKEVLLREVYHRVKNNMQMVSSLLSLQASSIDDPAVLKLLTESQRRVKTMALVHERLYRSENLARINFATYVEHLVSDLVRSYTSNKSAIRFVIEVSELELDLDTAVPCGLIINELISNALKYAFPNQKGEITLQFWLHNPEYYCLVVKDNGIGIPADIDPQCTNSLGMQLIQGLVEQLGGTLQLSRQGGSQFKILLKKRL
ncbi:signal transduction histidine kinase (plasmid) [Nostoc carneum NIES-2107]|nr:signal transduction histidine kinase [Nostoc carneum NIES-2107]